MANIIIEANSDTIPAPADTGDSLFFAGGGVEVDTGLALNGLSVGLVRIEVSPEFHGQVGAPGSPLYARATSELRYAAGGGAMYYRGTGSATALITIDSAGDFHFVTGGIATRFESVRGRSVIYAPATPTSLRISGGYVHLRDDVSATDPTEITLVDGTGGGVLVCERGATTLNAGSGEIIISAGANTFGTINALSGGKIRLRRSGTITLLNATGSIPDASKLVAPVTITNATINMSLHGASNLIDHPLITFTNAPTKILGDGRIA